MSIWLLTNLRCKYFLWIYGILCQLRISCGYAWARARRNQRQLQFSGMFNSMNIPRVHTQFPPDFFFVVILEQQNNDVVHRNDQYFLWDRNWNDFCLHLAPSVLYCSFLFHMHFIDSLLILILANGHMLHIFISSYIFTVNGAYALYLKKEKRKCVSTRACHILEGMMHCKQY